MRERVFTWMAALVVATGTLAGAAGPAAAADQTVRIEDFQFRPGGIQINVGDRVTWRNVDADQHRVESEDGSAVQFDSGDLDRDEQFTKAFDRAGTFHYHCRIHDSMNGIVEVTEGAPTTTTAPPPTTTTAPPPTTTTTEPPTTTTAPPPTTTTEPAPTTTAPPAREPDSAPSTTSTTKDPTSTTTSTLVPGEPTTTSSSSSTSSTSSTSTTVTTVAAPAAVPPPPEGPTAAGAVWDAPGGKGGTERDRSVIGSASGALTVDEGPSPWGVLGLILFAAVALFGSWSLWRFRPSRT